MSLACTGVAFAAPGGAREKFVLASQLHDAGDREQALAVIAEGLEIAPRDRALLGLKGRVMLALRDYEGASAAYQAYLATGLTGGDRRYVERTLGSLRAKLQTVKTTFLDVTLANGPGSVYLDSKSEGVLCVAAPSCHEGLMPASYKVIVERPGFQNWTGRVVVERGKTASLSITLTEKPSALAVRAEPAGAAVAVDDQPYNPKAKVPAGTHRVVVTLSGHQTARHEVTAREGQPIELDVALVPIVPAQIEPADAVLSLDGAPLVVEDGGLPIPSGAHVVTARAPGHIDARVEVPAERPESYQVAVTLARIPPPVVPPPPPPPVSHTRRWVGIGLAAGGVAMAGVGFAVGLKARSTHDDAVALCGADLICDSQEDFARGHQLVLDSRSQATISTVLVAAGGAAVAAGVIVWLTAPGERPEQSARIVPTTSGNDVGVALTGRF